MYIIITCINLGAAICTHEMKWILKCCIELEILNLSETTEANCYCKTYAEKSSKIKLEDTKIQKLSVCILSMAF